MADGKKTMAKDVQRGTQNELEILALIVAQNQPLRQRVMEQIRQLKIRQGNAKPRPPVDPAADRKTS